MNSSHRCKLMETHDKRDLIEISQLIDLTDKPIGLSCDEIGWSKVRSNASNCICCCSNNSIALVTTDDSYILDHVPLDNILFAQTNVSLQYLALSNHRKIAIIDLVDNDIKCSCYNNNNLSSETKVVNLSACGLTMGDIIFWRWLDDSTLAILSYDALYTCSVNQQHINHPAYTAFSNRSRLLSMEKVFDIHPHISALCQVTDIQRDITGNLYTISSLYSTSSLLKLNSANNTQQQSQQQQTTINSQNSSSSTLRPSFGSMPSRLSQLASNDQLNFDSLKAENLFDPYRSHAAAAIANNEDIVCGLVQVYCKTRDRSQLIQAHAITFTNSYSGVEQRSRSTRRRSSALNLDPNSQTQQRGPTVLVAANKIGSQLRVHFIEMATFDSCHLSTGQNASTSTSFNHLTGIDFPTSIVCSHVSSNDSNSSSLHVALITTKHGQLFVCSVAHSTVLFNTTMTNDIISSTILENTTKGLMVICRNGQVLLVTLNLAKIMRLLDESKTLRHISSSHNILNSINHSNNDRKKLEASVSKQTRSTASTNQLSASLDMGLEVLMSTKL